MSSIQKLTNTETAVQAANEGDKVNQDQWMSLWCSTNWGALLQPAPLSISLLGAILILASSTADFSGVHMEAGDGSQAFETAQAQMEKINNNTDKTGIPQLIKDIVGLIIDGSKEDIQSLFHAKINDLKGMCKTCLDAANATDSAFENLVGLAQEMVLACTYVVRTTEQAINQNKIHLEVLDKVKADQAALLKQSKAQVAFAKKSYTKAESGFYSAVNDVPSGWTLVGMEVVGDLGKGLSSALNAAVSYGTMRSQGAQTGLNSYSNLTGQQDQTPAAPEEAPVAPTTSPNGVSSQPNADALTDPGTVGVNSVLTLVMAMQSLLTGKDGKPDWDRIRKTSDSKDSQDGGLYIQASLESQKTELDPSAPFSQKLSPYIDDALNIIAAILKAAGSSASINDTALEPQVVPTEQLVMNLQGLSTSANLVLQQSGATATGPATPAPADQAQAAEASGAAQLAVQTAEMKVTQTRANLEASRTMYEKYTDELTKQQQDITATIGDITQTKLTDATLEHMLPVLAMAVGSFTKLRAQFSQLVQFFDHVASLLDDVMAPSLTTWIHALTSAEGEEKKVAGITLSKYMQNLIYTGMMTPLKVSMLANKVSGVYMSVSKLYILPAQEQVGGMLLFSGGTTEADKKALIAKLKTAQVALAASTKDTNDKISALVLKDQKDFNTTITARLKDIENGLKDHMPAVIKPVPAHVRAITKAHGTDTANTRALQNGVNPMFTLHNAF
ncbi:hypothetical protein C8J57DRAFT_1575490 [Mycena rebaudengoi]|nr:hypothetical protein C8J57DRAFT_1575490 [Mycena rebaudengoi]